MAQSRLSMRKIRDVLRLSAAGLSKRQIAASLGIGPTAPFTWAGGFAHLSETPAPPRQVRKEVPDKLEGAILAALAKAPDDRPASAKAFIDAAF